MRYVRQFECDRDVSVKKLSAIDADKCVPGNGQADILNPVFGTRHTGI